MICNKCGKWAGAHATLPGQPTDHLCMGHPEQIQGKLNAHIDYTRAVLRERDQLQRALNDLVEATKQDRKELAELQKEVANKEQAIADSKALNRQLHKQIEGLQAKVQEQALQIISDIGQEIDAEPKPLPGADWTVTMRRMMDSGCSKKNCTCKPENAPNCIWWDEPGDRPQPKAEPVQDGLRKAAQMALEAIEELRYSSSTFKADKLSVEALAALREALNG